MCFLCDDQRDEPEAFRDAGMHLWPFWIPASLVLTMGGDILHVAAAKLIGLAIMATITARLYWAIWSRSSDD